jgi:hypothetical protein
MASINLLRAGAPPLRIAARPGVRIWLFGVAALIFAMVLIGGATRITESGLSITQWKPVTGVIPPLSPPDWQAEFDRYKQIPQFARLNPDMTLDGFKTIFWWEWSHRLMARIVGAVFILPGLWFWMRGELKGALGRQVAVATGLLALERADRSRPGTAGAASDDRRGDVRGADQRRRGLERAGARRSPARVRGVGRGLRISRLAPARPRRAGRRPPRRAHL